MIIINKDVFCKAPFIGIAKHTHMYSMCCRYDSEISSYNDIEIENIYNSKLLMDMRLKMINKDIPVACLNCSCVKNMYNDSKYNDIFEHNLLNMNNDGYVNNYKIGNLHYVFNNICNLSCLTCGGFSSSKYQSRYNFENFVNIFPKYKNNLCKIGKINKDNISHIINNNNNVDIVLAGGEFMLMDSNLNIIKNINTNNNIHLYTNGTIYNDDILYKLNSMSNCILYLSIDGDYEHNHIYRPVAKLENVFNTYEYIKNNYSNIIIKFCYTLSNINISNMINTLDILSKYDNEIIINVVDNPDYLSIMSNSYNFNSNYHMLCMALVKYIDNSNIVSQIRDILYKFNIQDKRDMSIEYNEYMKIVDGDVNE